MKIRLEVFKYLLATTLTTAVLALAFMWGLFNTGFGDGVPPIVRVGGPVVIWVATVLYFATNIKRFVPQE